MKRRSSAPRPDGRPAVPARVATTAATDQTPSWVGEQPAEVRAPLDITGSATGYTAAWGRREFTAWLAVDLPAGGLFDDLVLAVYEALANTAEHAYRDTDEPGPVRLLARRSRDAVQIVVTDHGTWHPTPSDGAPAESFRGRGLSLITMLVHDMHLDLGPAGTLVHLRTPLPPPIS